MELLLTIMLSSHPTPNFLQTGGGGVVIDKQKSESVTVSGARAQEKRIVVETEEYVIYSTGEVIKKVK